MNVLLTGGAGFIGSHLATALLKNNHIDLTIVDMLHSYYSVDRKKKRLAQLKETGTFHFYPTDLTDAEAVAALFKEKHFDVVIHLAALPGVAYSIEHPNEYVDFDIKATINVLKQAGENNVKHVIFASSSSVYGDQKNQPLVEHSASGKVVSPYAAAKAGAESFCHAFHHMYNFDMTILRFFTVYGPWGRPDMAIPLFIDRLMKQEPITVFDLETARDYTYIDDIVAGIMLAMEHGKGYSVYNLGYGKPIQMKTLLNTLKVNFPNMQMNVAGWRTGDVHSTWADVTKAKKELGFSAKVSFEEGLARTIEWAKNDRSNKKTY